MLIQEGIFDFQPPSLLQGVAPYPLNSASLLLNEAKVSPDGALRFRLMAENYSLGVAVSGSSPAKHTLCCSMVSTIPNGSDSSGERFFFVKGPTPEIRCYRFDWRGLVGGIPALSATQTPDNATFD